MKHELSSSKYPARRKQCQQALELMGLESYRDATEKNLEGTYDTYCVVANVIILRMQLKNVWFDALWRALLRMQISFLRVFIRQCMAARVSQKKRMFEKQLSTTVECKICI